MGEITTNKGIGGTPITVKTVAPLWENTIYVNRSSTLDNGPDAEFPLQPKKETYTLKLDGKPSQQSKELASMAVETALSDNSLDSMNAPQKQFYLTNLANNTIADSESWKQSQLIDNPSNLNTQVTQYSPTYDYSKDLENSILNPGTYDTLGPVSGQVTKINSQSSVGNAKGITVNERDRKLDGEIVDPYKNIANVSGEVVPYDIVGGADLTAFLIMEYPKLTQENLDLDPSIQEKEIVMIEMDNVLSISYSTIRERFPVRQLGKLNPVALTGGLRTIAGHIAFTIFTEDVLGRLRSRVQNMMESVNKQINGFKATTESSKADLEIRKNEWAWQQQAYNNFLADASANSITLLDSLPPFNLLIMGTNENGTFVQFMIRGVSVVDENQYQGTQQPNIINKVSYVATDLVPMHKITDTRGRKIVHSANSIDESYSKGKYNGRINFNYEVSGSGLVDTMLTDLTKGR